MAFKGIEQTLPVYWASYLVNNDGSGLEDGEDKQVAETLSRLELSDCECVDVKDDSHFHTPEPYMNWLDAGAFATYVFHKNISSSYMECEDSEGNEISMDVAKTIEANKGLLEQMELRQEEINHPEKTVYQRAFIKNFDD